MSASHPTASQHLTEDRWPARGNPQDDAQDAWQRGHHLDLPTGRTTGAYPRLPPHDEARVDPETRTVLFRRDDCLVTCYQLEIVDTWHGHAARAAVRDQYPELITE